MPHDPSWLPGLEVDILKDSAAIMAVFIADDLVYGVEASIEAAFAKAVTHVDST